MFFLWFIAIMMTVWYINIVIVSIINGVLMKAPEANGQLLTKFVCLLLASAAWAGIICLA